MVMSEVAGIMCHAQVKEELWAWRSTIGCEVCFIENCVSGGFDAATTQVQVANVKVSGGVSEENSVECVTIKFGWAFARDFGSDS
jgi:hypothetical protein